MKETAQWRGYVMEGFHDNRLSGCTLADMDQSSFDGAELVSRLERRRKESAEKKRKTRKKRARKNSS